MVDELLAGRGTIVSYETLRQWAHKFGQAFANQIGADPTSATPAAM